MGDILNSVKVRVCFECKQYSPLFPENAKNERFIKLFDSWHTKHPLQTVNIYELDSSYECITEMKRKQMYEVLIK